MLKIVVLFLMLMLIISMVGNLVTKLFNPKPPETPKTQGQATCANCGRVVVGTAPCICGKG